MKKEKIWLFFIFCILFEGEVLADGWDSKKASHSVLYSDTITSKTDASSVNVADELFVTGDVSTLSNFFIYSTKFVVGKNSLNNNFNLMGIDSSDYLQIGPGVDGLNGIRIFPSQLSGELIRLTNDGKVGIGTPNPSEKLEVNGNIKATGTICDLNGCIGGVSGLWNQNGNNIFYNNGNVGIGTTNLTRKLDVFGDIHIHMAPSDGGLYFGDNDPVNSKWHIGYWEPSIAPPNGALIFTETGVADYIITLKAGGNVGIGKADPQSKLDVNGDIKSENIGKTIWSKTYPTASGSYSLRTIFDTARNNGLVPGVYDCVLRSSNPAHWTRRRFTAAVNYYTNNPSFPHKFHNVIDIQAEPSGGCSAGLTSFDAANGNFDFDSGNCNQDIRLLCNRLD